MEETTTRAGKNELKFTERVWRLFSSVKLAFTLMIVIALLSLLGSLIMQYSGERDLYQSWLENAAQNQYGMWTPIMALLQLFRVFHSIWFLGAGVLLVINILVCSLDRWKRIMGVIRGGQIVQAEGYYQADGKGIQLNHPNSSSESAINSIANSLKERGYHVRQKTSGDKVYFSADKNRFFRLGTYLTHFSLVLFVVGFLVTGALGYRNNSFAVMEGSVEHVGDNSGLSLKLLSFTDEYYSNGSPKDFRSEVIIYDLGKQISQGTIRVNHPLSYKGYRFFQSSFGSTVLIQIKGESGEALFNGSIALNQPIQIETMQLDSGGIELPQAGLEIWTIKPRPGGGGSMIGEDELVIQIIDHNTQQVVNMGRVTQSSPVTLNNLEISYLGDAQFSGFQVTRDPGTGFIWAASIFMLAGLITVFYFPLRQIWGMSVPTGAKTSRILLRTSNSHLYNASSELNNLAKDFESRGRRKPT